MSWRKLNTMFNKLSNTTFVLTVNSDSMDVPGGYREGEMVYVDPDAGMTWLPNLRTDARP